MAVRWMRKGKPKQKRYSVPRAPVLDMEEILRWADAWKARAGSWPRHISGRIPESLGDNWSKINAALYKGLRGLPGGSSLAQLLTEHRGIRNHQRLPHLEISQILAWADAHHRRTGDWPLRTSGPIADAAGETWMAVEMALSTGNRALPGGSSLARLLSQERGLRNLQNLPDLSIEQILAWADAHFRRTGAWPKHISGAIQDAPDEKWHGMEHALRSGQRGLPGGSSIYQLLVAHGRIKPSRPRGLQRRRIEASLSRRDLAKVAGVNPNTVRHWENGHYLPRPAMLAAVAKALGLPLEQLRAEMEAVRNDRRKEKQKNARLATGIQ